MSKKKATIIWSKSFVLPDHGHNHDIDLGRIPENLVIGRTYRAEVIRAPLSTDEECYSCFKSRGGIFCTTEEVKYLTDMFFPELRAMKNAKLFVLRQLDVNYSREGRILVSSLYYLSPAGGVMERGCVSVEKLKKDHYLFCLSESLDEWIFD